jgi:hypothetical protein
MQWWKERRQLLSGNSTRNILCESIWIVIQQQAENNKNCMCKLWLRILQQYILSKNLPLGMGVTQFHLTNACISHKTKRMLSLNVFTLLLKIHFLGIFKNANITHNYKTDLKVDSTFSSPEVTNTMTKVSKAHILTH